MSGHIVGIKNISPNLTMPVRNMFTGKYFNHKGKLKLCGGTNLEHLSTQKMD